MESDRPRVAGVVVRELSDHPSSWRATGGLTEWLAAARIPVVAEVDTRQLTRHIRSKGAMRGVLATGSAPTDAVRLELDRSPRMDGLDLASAATVAREYVEGPADAVAPILLGVNLVQDGSLEGANVINLDPKLGPLQDNP